MLVAEADYFASHVFPFYVSVFFFFKLLTIILILLESFYLRVLLDDL